MGAPISKAQSHTKALFNDKLIDEVFKVKEFAFDSKILKEIVLEKYDESDCELRLNTKVKNIEKNLDETINVY